MTDAAPLPTTRRDGTVQPSPMSAAGTPRVPSLSIFFPAYNDSGTIASLVISARAAALQLTPDFEIIIVNDGSPDNTAAIADELARTYPEVRAIHHPSNRGYGGALKTGFQEARKDFIFYTDGDAQYDPAEVSLLWPHLTDEVDLVNGYKISRSDPWHRIVIGRIYHHTVKILFGLPVKDVDCDFRLMRRSIFNRVRLERTSGVICVEMMKKIHDCGFRIAEVPVHHFHRAFGRSQFFNFRRLAKTAVDLARLWVELVIVRRHVAAGPIDRREPLRRSPS
jgi:glycosyltransferase involved in cell wall biosynthesis